MSAALLSSPAVARADDGDAVVLVLPAGTFAFSVNTAGLITEREGEIAGVDGLILVDGTKLWLRRRKVGPDDSPEVA